MIPFDVYYIVWTDTVINRDTNSTPQVHLSLDAPDTILVYTNIYTNAVSGLLSLSMTVDRFRKIQPVRQGLRF